MLSLQQSDQQATILTALSTLLPGDQLKLVTQSGGGNSVVYCIEVNGEKCAVKSYPPYAPGKRDRLAAEVQVYEFLNSHGVASVPALKQFSHEHRLLIMDWIDGAIPENYTDQDIDQALNFINTIVTLNKMPDAASLPMAAEACLSLNIIINQVASRLQRLQTLTEAEPALKNFLEAEFLPVFDVCQKMAIEGYRSAGLNPESELPSERQSLIPADFGFHNTIKDAAGQLYFFDFDYFGWDDPVKLLADILWHPKMQLSPAHQQRFISGITQAYQHDDQFVIRFQHTLALFGLRWTLIYLNEFLPECWQNRQHASVHKNHADAKVSQLKRARESLQQVQAIGKKYDIISETSI